MTSTISARHVADPFCQHEFDDGAICANQAQPGPRHRCVDHLDDGQPAYELLTPASRAAKRQVRAA